MSRRPASRALAALHEARPSESPLPAPPPAAAAVVGDSSAAFSATRSMTSVAVISGVSVRIWNSVTKKLSSMSRRSSCNSTSPTRKSPPRNGWISSLPSRDTPP